MEDWLKIKTEYITTDTSYRKLAEKYGVHYQTICARSKAEGWIQLREQYQNRTITKTVEQISNKTAKQAAKATQGMGMNKFATDALVPVFYLVSEAE